jgi:flagellar basal-body rod protein FlgC
MYGALDISTSGLVAQRVRMTAISANIANQGTILDSDGRVNPYRRRQVHFAPGDPTAPTRQGRAMGVHVAEIQVNQDAIRWKFDPTNPYANREGYVPYPDIDPVTEQINALEASRAYEANLAAAEATKSMMAQALRLLA